MKAELDGVAAPAEHPFRLAGMARAIFDRHPGLESATRGSCHTRTRPLQIFDLRGE
jgi:hypothetical protein